MADGWRAGLISVVVPTYNRLDVLLRVLAGFERQTLAAGRFELIVVDDGSDDGTPERLAAYAAACPYGLTRLRQANRGPAAARNRGLAEARGEVVLFVDDDCVPLPDLLERHLEAHVTPGLAVIGRITWHPELPATPFMRYAEPHMFFPYGAIAVPYDAPFICFYTGNASVHADSARAVGGFDEGFPHAGYEDIDFGYRLRRGGVRLLFEPAALVHHYRTAELLPTLERSRLMGRELVRFWRKHPELHGFVPTANLIDPSLRRRFYETVAAYYLTLGMEEALGAPPAPAAASAPATASDPATAGDRGAVAATAVGGASDSAATLDPAEVLPAGFVEQAQIWAAAQLVALEGELDRLGREGEEARRERDELRRQLESQAADAARLAEWAAGLEARLRRREGGWPARLRRRLAGRTR